MKKDYKSLEKALLIRKRSLMEPARQTDLEVVDTRTGDDIDLAESAYEQEMVYIMKSREAKELKIIDEALEKIKNGEYGICEECGEQVAPKRLEAMPFVKYCVKCQAQIEEEAAYEGYHGEEYEGEEE